MLRAYIFFAGAGAGAAAAAAFVLDFGAAAMGADFAGLDAFALAGAFFAAFGACERCINHHELKRRGGREV